MLGNLLMLNYATDSLINLNRELLYQPILSICGIIGLSLLKYLKDIIIKNIFKCQNWLVCEPICTQT